MSRAFRGSAPGREEGGDLCLGGWFAVRGSALPHALWVVLARGGKLFKLACQEQSLTLGSGRGVGGVVAWGPHESLRVHALVS